MVVNAMMGADSSMFEYLLGGGIAQILVQLIDENMDQALLDRAIVSFFFGSYLAKSNPPF